MKQTKLTRKDSADAVVWQVKCPICGTKFTVNNATSETMCPCCQVSIHCRRGDDPLMAVVV